MAASGTCPWPGHIALAPDRIGRLPQAASGACPGRIGCLPQAASGACPGHTETHPRYLFTLRSLGALPIAVAGCTPRPHRAHSRYLCKLRDWAHSQSYAAGLPAVCHKWPGALPQQACATTRHSPRLGALQAFGGNVSAFNANATSQASTRFAQLVWPHGYCWYPPARFNKCCTYCRARVGREEKEG